MKNGTFDNTLMFLASPQLRYEMSPINIEHPVEPAVPMPKNIAAQTQSNE